jgi:hypothetical protein
VESFHFDMLKPYFGSEKAAYEAALIDDGQHVVAAVTHYCGDPQGRKTCEFLVHYADGDSQWVVWKEDLMSCESFKYFVQSARNFGNFYTLRSKLCGLLS